MARPTGKIEGLQNKPAVSASKLAEGARDEVLKAAGLSLEKLGKQGKELAQTILEEFTALGGRPTDAQLAEATSRLKAVTDNESPAKPRIRLPALPEGEQARVPTAHSDGSYLKSEGGKLTLHPVLAAEGHGIGKLLRALGIDPQDIPANAANVIDDALRKNGVGPIGKDAWGLLLRELPKHAAVSSPAPVTKTEKVAKTPEATPKEPIGEAPARNQGLEAKAPESTGTGNKNNAIALLARNLGSFNKAKQDSPELAALSTKIADAFAAQAEASGGQKLTAGDRKKIELVLKKVLAPDANSPDGEVRITTLAANAFRELASIQQAKNGGDAGVFGLASQIMSRMNQAIVSAEPAKVDELLSREPGKKRLADSFDELAGFALGNLINAELGRPIEQPNSGLLGKMTGLLGNLGGTEAKKVAKQLNAEMRPGSPTARALEKGKAKLEAGAAAQITPELRQSAEAELKRLIEIGPADSPLRGLDPKSPAGKRVVGALAQVLSGAKNDQEIITKAAEYFKEQTGISHPRLESVKAVLDAGKSISDDQKALLKQDALTQITLFAANPEQYLAAIQPHLDQAAHRSPASIDHRRVDVGQFRSGGPHQFGVAGITGTGNPRDAGSAKAQIYAQRSQVISMVLNDPALSIEDKIFLFMMWFAAFADEERKLKMEELAELDRVDAEKHQLLKRQQDALSNVNERAAQLHGEHEKAEKALTEAKAGGDPEAIKKAEADVLGAGKRVVENDNRRKQIEGEIDRLQRETQEAPKSREILLFELDRITQLRGNIMDMAKHFLEDSNRRIKEIMR